MELWDSWIAVALISAAAWGLSCVIDVCFVAERVYREPLEGPLVAGLFCIVPILTSGGSVTLPESGSGVTVVALLAGIFYLLHIYFYFKALFVLNDAPNAEIFNTLTVLFVPLLAFVFLGETLSAMHYFAIALSIVGTLILVRSQLSAMTGQVVVLLCISVLCISLVMVMQAWVLQFVGYNTAIFLFSFGSFASVVMLLCGNGRLRGRILTIFGRVGLVLVAIQLLELGAVLGSQRATDVGPSVSLVASLECSLPVFVMCFSWMFVTASRYWQLAQTRVIRRTLASQTEAYPAKLLSLCLIVAAIGLVQP